jgi:hypothetical protein
MTLEQRLELQEKKMDRLLSYFGITDDGLKKKRMRKTSPRRMEIRKQLLRGK